MDKITKVEAYEYNGRLYRTKEDAEDEILSLKLRAEFNKRMAWHPDDIVSWLLDKNNRIWLNSVINAKTRTE